MIKLSKNMAKELTMNVGGKSFNIKLMFSVCREIGRDSQRQELPIIIQYTRQWNELAAKAIQGPSLPLEGVDYIHGSDSLPLGMFSVSDSIPDHVLKEDLQNAAGLLVD